MITGYTLRKMIDERGPRWLVHGTIRRDEYAVHYADTAEKAESWRDTLIGSHHRHVTVVPPAGSVDLVALGHARQAAIRAVADATNILRAGVLRALEDGRTESEVARTAQVDRMTVRKWAADAGLKNTEK